MIAEQQFEWNDPFGLVSKLCKFCLKSYGCWERQNLRLAASKSRFFLELTSMALVLKTQPLHWFSCRLWKLLFAYAGISTATPELFSCIKGNRNYASDGICFRPSFVQRFEVSLHDTLKPASSKTGFMFRSSIPFKDWRSILTIIWFYSTKRRQNRTAHRAVRRSLCVVS